MLLYMHITHTYLTIFMFCEHTQEVISREVISIPHLKGESSRNLVLCLIPGKHGFLLGDDYLLLSH